VLLSSMDNGRQVATTAVLRQYADDPSISINVAVMITDDVVMVEVFYDVSGEDSLPVLTDGLPDPFASPVTNKQDAKLSVLNAQLSDQFSTHTRNNSSITVNDLGISHSINTPQTWLQYLMLL
jgi:hypothetical protein